MGAEAAHAAGLTSAPRLYICPLCFEQFDDPKSLTWEDVPARRAGGRPLVLTCEPCNNRGGRTVNMHAAAELDYAQLQSGLLARDRHAWLRLDDLPVLRVLLRDDLSAATALGDNAPGLLAKWRTRFDSLERSGIPEVTVQASLPPGEHSPWQARVAELRDAYLAAFAVLGFGYIARPELDIVRTQLREFETDHIKIFAATAATLDTETGWDVRICNWERRITAVVVRFGHRFVYLPSLVPGTSASIYNYLKSISPGQEVQHVVLELQDEMLCALDRDPEFRSNALPWLQTV